MSYYIDFDQSGCEIKTPKGRGRTRKGYVKVDDNFWVESSCVNLFKLKRRYSSSNETKVVKAKKPNLLEDFKSAIKSIRTESKNNGVVSFVGCDIKKDLNIPCLNAKQIKSRIDVNRNNGCVYIWDEIYTQGAPDIIVGGAVKV